MGCWLRLTILLNLEDKRVANFKFHICETFGKKKIFFKAGLNSCPAPFVGCGNLGRTSFSFKPQCLPLQRGQKGAVCEAFGTIPAAEHACGSQAVVGLASSITTREGWSQGVWNVTVSRPTCRCRMKGKGGSVGSSFHFCHLGKPFPATTRGRGRNFS